MKKGGETKSKSLFRNIDQPFISLPKSIERNRKGVVMMILLL